ncbi:hypothetical protein FOA52_000296 [Chlamydomonas sp. UWO 241]|nr:hypothetical protein FOA52_000296 [Chlamydomonas sp. UWO 241]
MGTRSKTLKDLNNLNLMALGAGMAAIAADAAAAAGGAGAGGWELLREEFAEQRDLIREEFSRGMAALAARVTETEARVAGVIAAVATLDARITSKFAQAELAFGPLLRLVPELSVAKDGVADLDERMGRMEKHEVLALAQFHVDQGKSREMAAKVAALTEQVQALEAAARGGEAAGRQVPVAARAPVTVAQPVPAAQQQLPGPPQPPGPPPLPAAVSGGGLTFAVVVRERVSDARHALARGTERALTTLLGPHHVTVVQARVMFANDHKSKANADVVAFTETGHSDKQMEIAYEAYAPLPDSDAMRAAAENAETKAGLLSYLTFSWLSPLLVAGYNAPLKHAQIPELCTSDRVGIVSADLARHWRKEQREATPSLPAACWATTRNLFLAALPFKLVNDLSQFVGPIFINLLLKVIADPAAPMWKGYLYAGLMLLGNLIGMLADHQHFNYTLRAGFRLSSSLGALVHAKLLHLAPSARPAFSSGRIFSLISSDAETLSMLCQGVFGIVSSPLRITIAIAMLYQQLGVSSLVTVVCLLVMIPINIRLVRWSGAMLKTALAHTDERTKLEGELIGGIEVVKCSAWEVPFLGRINISRAKELAMLWRFALLQAVIAFVLFAIPTLVPVATFGTYLFLGNSLSSAEAFTSLALFNVLRFPLFLVPQLLNMLAQAQVSLNRIQEFLQADTLEDVAPSSAAPAGETAISLHGDFGWDDKGVPALADVNLDVPSGSLVVVVGPTGSGKTCLLSAMLGEMQALYGQTPVLRGRVAFVPQAAFLINATVRDNILFGQPFDAGRYAECVRKACLDTDLAMLPGGNQTELGDKGVNLSGGQRQRVSLARALYSNADVLLLDDPLSALDSKVGRRVFEGGIRARMTEAAAAGSPVTVVLATNQLSFVQAADLVLFMAGGRVAEAGSFPQMIAAGGAFAAMMKEVQMEDEDAPAAAATAAAAPAAAMPPSASSSSLDKTGGKDKGGKDEKRDKKDKKGKRWGKQAPTTAPEVSPAASVAGDSPAPSPRLPPTKEEVVPELQAIVVAPAPADVAAPAAAAAAAAAPAGRADAAGARLTSEETTAQGAISMAVVLQYVSAMGGSALLLWLTFSFLGVEALRVATTVWLSFWTSTTDAAGRGGEVAHGPMFYLGWYAAISGLQLVAQLGNILDNARLTLRAARTLHDRLLGSLLAAPMSFFHTTPPGRIINRLTKDTSDVDRQLGQNLSMVLRSFLQLISAVGLIGWVAPLSLPPLTVIMLGFYLMFSYFQSTLRQVKRLEAVSRSPVFTSLSEAISGGPTIRAFGSGPRLVDRHRVLINEQIKNTHACNSLNRWLGVRLEGLGAFATFCAAVVAVENRAGASSAGLVLSYAMQLTILMAMTLRMSSVAENNLNSVERVCEYSDLPFEGCPEDADGTRPGDKKHRRRDGGNGGGSGATGVMVVAAPGWPAQGLVEFKNVTMRYRPGLPLVLRGVTFHAAARTKLGIVGRTGAGKSSLIGTLFRLTELEGGSVIIDGVDISKLSLTRLRSSMALIPQVPVLFTGSIRLNLSPFGLHSDAELWSALRRAHLAGVVEGWPAGLDSLLQEGGAPLSAGQRQLLALARALLNPSRVLVLDEATANVDVETDAVIQKTMREQFSDRTILAIAHRLHTIIDYDQVLVLDKGLVAEFGAPKELLANAGGVFTSMVNDTGEATSRFLKAVAAGSVDLAASISEAATVGMGKLSAPVQAAVGAQLSCLLESGLSRGALTHALAEQMLERARAAIAAATAATRGLLSGEDEDEDVLAAEAELLGRVASSGPGARYSERQELSDAHRSMLLAVEMLAQVEQYAVAAARAARRQEVLRMADEDASGGGGGGGAPGGGGASHAPSNLGALARFRSARTNPAPSGASYSSSPTSRGADADAPLALSPRDGAQRASMGAYGGASGGAAVRSAREEEMRSVLATLCDPRASPSACPALKDGPSGSCVRVAESVAESRAAVRSASAIMRSVSVRERKGGHGEQ